MANRDEDTETFADEWTEMDVADPRWGTWALCWPNSEWGRFGELPCPNMTLNPADGKWDKSPLFYSGWKFHACDEACKKRINAEAANDWMPGPSCGDNQSYSNPLPGCGGTGDSATDYYRAPIGSYADMMLYYQKKMIQTFADGIYCALSNRPVHFFWRCNLLTTAAGAQTTTSTSTQVTGPVPSAGQDTRLTRISAMTVSCTRA